MYCNNCGFEIPEGKNFCTECGKQIKSNQKASPPMPTNTRRKNSRGQRHIKPNRLRIALIFSAVIATTVSIGVIYILFGEQSGEAIANTHRDSAPDKQHASQSQNNVSQANNDNENPQTNDDSSTDIALRAAPSSSAPDIYNNSIMGTTTTSVEQMVQRYNDTGHPYPTNVYQQYGAKSIEDFCQLLTEEAEAEEVRAEVVFAQTMIETGWLQFGGVVSAEQCNFGGLGASDGEPGASFNIYGNDSVRMGLRAQVQHLKAYASNDELNNDCIDPRFDYVERGIAPSIFDLSGTWSADQELGDKIMTQLKLLLTT